MIGPHSAVLNPQIYIVRTNDPGAILVLDAFRPHPRLFSLVKNGP